MIDKRVELLAPAGNIEAFYGAIHAGADAVYLGGNKFGARAYAENFTTDELVACIRYAHIWGRRVYLTVNTLVKEKEFDQLYDYILPFYEAGLDGVIIQDIGVFLFIKEHFPGLELHISTQMTLTGKYGAAYMKDLGACRIVPARELSLSEISVIKKETGLSIETFIHGAMCYCYSGQCLFSSILGGRSGNRGRCAQPCRLPYTVSDESKQSKECYPLSLKDMCTIENIPELIEAGIDSFKIEGRMKKAEYAAGVTAVYRKVIDRYYDDPHDFRVYPEELEMLSRLYLRSERHDGYYHKHNGSDMVTIDSPAYNGSDETLLSQIRRSYIDQKPVMNVAIFASFNMLQPASVTMVCGDHSVTVTGDVVEEAQKQPITAENIRKQLSKLGDTSFCAESIHIEVDSGSFYPLKSINELRRQAVTELEEEFIKSFGLSVGRVANVNSAEIEDSQPYSPQCVSKSNTCHTALTVTVRTLDQLSALSDAVLEDKIQVRRIYVDSDLLTGNFSADSILLLKDLCRYTEIFAALPYIIRHRDKIFMRELYQWISENDSIIHGCMVRSLEGYAYLKESGYSEKISSDAGFYIWNRKTLEYWRDKLDCICLPWELNAGEQKSLLNSIDNNIAEKIVYGRLPMMITANCVARTSFACRKEESVVWLTDRFQKKFPVAINCTHCMNIIYNSVPLSLHGSFHKWSDSVFCRLDFTVEDKKETAQILSYYFALSKGIGSQLPFSDYTTGHEKRGVE